ncbi:hypothetical protein FRP30_04935 [Campylobacter jejuni]|uniref:hypothetical protein n=1 Tax=Campylobacter jejuni TaxID=197 RepID=UPI0013076697|nr:hypothetical protein [Campylobacter jejuni]EAI4847369.1 hypothetical protein [Campylobacter jejuni]EAI6345512.1 hypothetical protein [Campylobacter jejuni]EAI8630284.1 hypothetical protein [Campylobacter jejuni]ECK7542969.1 hypothetical protein [Campylobacter jejuni]ECR2481589.1 hypothetical protein [Campylobacter jejuni]
MMRGIYKEDKKIIICIFITSFILFLIISYFLLCVMDIKKIIEPMENFTTNIITFISIAFGFYLTSLSVIFSSKYIGMLNTTDERKPDQKKIHTLREYFKLTIYCALTTIVVSFMTLICIFFNERNIIAIVFALLVAIFIENFIFIYLLLKIFTDALVIQARKDN